VAQKYVLSLDDQRATLETVGGKGASLARLLQAGMPVPGGFHVTTAAYERFVAENDLKSGIRAALEKADASKPDTLTNASEKIGDVFLRADLPEGVSGAISEAYAGLAQVDPAVAVRSSATTEDLPGASFAGQQATSLNVRGEDELLEAVRRCWAASWRWRPPVAAQLAGRSCAAFLLRRWTPRPSWRVWPSSFVPRTSCGPSSLPPPPRVCPKPSRVRRPVRLGATPSRATSTGTATRSTTWTSSCPHRLMTHCRSC
jgi:hypothetical protein